MEVIRVKPTKEVKSVSQFIDYVMKWKRAGVKPTAFRGQSFYGWPIKPKIFRQGLNIYENEGQAIRDVISLHPSEFDGDKTMFDRLVRMQHFGLPTRLLDVTINPLVALWFASEKYIYDGDNKSVRRVAQGGRITAYFVPVERQKYYDSDTVSCLANIANLRLEQKDELFELASLSNDREEFNTEDVVDYLCYHVGMEKPHFRKVIKPEDLLFPIYVKPKLNNKRIVAQSGAFVLYGSRNYTPSSNPTPIPARSIFIPPSAKERIRRELETLGIHESTIFPDIERTSKFVTMRYQNALNDRVNELL
ncbi:FRG domain-containing protein [Enterobacter hormaechei]|uniref:FRG domain-containing protein n=1 Tax=Enterobacter hormaechei TaxID=158836 RepID=UPI000795A95F|nr:FRG domain-containing protein [Enterobacter hormaechei]ELN8898522.1 FRG domain-containing protein [Enterobacter hormaechei subsp. xiangfangensis]MCU2509763.1 FRG domain-containing protein [Enterobacter hormaechei subsp. hoffmannii]PSS47603.1 FRG domain-containing protein [Enterobacter sp. FS01]CAE7780026.1 hypothetical protein AI2796V1_3513 [Enterobacter cloacae]CAH3875622.1 hypothetical protein AI2796V1_3513 [Enterobacter cloacae]